MRNVRFNKIRKKVLKGYSGLSLQPYSADPVSQNLNKYKDLGDIMARNAMYYSDTQVALAKLKQEDLLRRKNEASYALNQKPKKLEALDPVLNNLNSKYQEIFSDQSLVPNYMQDINSFQKDLDTDTSSLLTDQQKIYAGLETADYSTDEDTNTNLVSANRKDSPENSKFSYNANWKDINRGLDLAEMNLHAIGAHDKDSQGTAMAKGIIQGAGEIAGLFNPMVGAIIKGFNVADSILGYAGVGPRTNTFNKDDYTFEQIGGSYGSSLAAANKAEDVADKRHGFLGLFGRRKTRRDNALIAEANRQQNVMSIIADANRSLKLGAEAMSDINHLQNEQLLAGGFDAKFARVAKEGGNIDKLSFIDYINKETSFVSYVNDNLNQVSEMLKEGGTINKVSFVEYLNEELKNHPEMFKEGGVLSSPNNIESTQANVIPEGALHKNKHHLDETGFDDSEITKKGIPVLDNAGNQQAEIELNEIIFSLEVTKFLEENYHKYYESSKKDQDELALKVGKELVFQILNNTKDNTGLIEIAKDGTKLQLK